jgi:hypothetical protein
MTHEFSSEQDAARAMLLDVAQLMNQRTIDYAVIGGWIPYLFNSSPIGHPGTYDVDIVLNTSMNKDDVVGALDAMVKDRNYMRAPKNAFQIYRSIRVNGEDMIFHVDFLHRKYADDTDDLTRSWGRYESIGTLGTDVIFTRKQARTEFLSATGLDGAEISSDVVFATEAGFLCAKGRSTGLGKRERDGFDIYLVIKQSADPEKLSEACRNLLDDGVFYVSLKRIYDEFVINGASVERAVKYLCGASSEFSGKEGAAAEEISITVREFVGGIIG